MMKQDVEKRWGMSNMRGLMWGAVFALGGWIVIGGVIYFVTR